MKGDSGLAVGWVVQCVVCGVVSAWCGQCMVWSVSGIWLVVYGGFSAWICVDKKCIMMHYYIRYMGEMYVIHCYMCGGLMAGALFCMVRVPMLVDDEDSEAIVIAVDTLHLLNSLCPGFAVGIRTMVVVAVQEAPQFVCHKFRADTKTCV